MSSAFEIEKVSKNDRCFYSLVCFKGISQRIREVLITQKYLGILRLPTKGRDHI